MRQPITALALVNCVCLLDLDLSAVLRRHGWAPKGLHRDRLRKGLCAALDRMQGLRRTEVWHSDEVNLGFRLPDELGG